MLYSDRRDAGRRLAARLQSLRGADIVALGLPRGGVPVAFEVAKALDAPLDVIVMRKLRRPASAGTRVRRDRRGRRPGDQRPGGRTTRSSALRRCRDVERQERAELERRVDRFRGVRPEFRWRAAPRSSSMTASRPERQPARRAKSARGRRAGRSGGRAQTRWPRWRTMPMR